VGQGDGDQRAKEAEPMLKTRTVVLGLAVLLTGVVGQAQETALDVYLEEHPGALESGLLGPLETRALAAMTPEQAEAYAAGTDPEQIVLQDGATLAELLAALLAGGQGLVYVPLESCVVLRTVDTPAGALAADESREFFVRGTDLSAQGGSATGCLVPAEAVAVALHFRTLVLAEGVPGRLLVRRVLSGVKRSNLAVEYRREGETGRRASGTTVVGLCEGTCATGEIEVTAEAVAAQVRGEVIGYFRPIEAADVPGGISGGDADTLDGLDSTDFALAVHTHDGADITSGTVGEPFIDPLIARDSEVVPIVLANDGSGSTLDADLLDGRDSLDLALQVDNCLTVSSSCPAAAAEALAARCWQTISAALAEIGTGLPAAGVANRYQIKVGPGTFSEQVTMKGFVDIEGSGEKLTVVTSVSSPTLAGASDAELRHLAVENSGGGTAIQNSGVSPTIKHVTARATGAGAPKAVQIGMGAAPQLTHVTTLSDGDGVENNDTTISIRDSVLSGAVNGIENVGAAATASIVNTQIMGGAADGGSGTTFTCLGAYDAAFSELDANCQ
jgi:hypothetical protein